ncbi:MAG: hypothetical protein JO123_00690 [Ktedonobacteraceae bacterium]|nr:hypothetical protein [Ktedonobacteraceae bacterium]
MSKQETRQQTKQERRRERREEQQRREQQRLRAARTRRMVTIGVIALVTTAIVGVYFIVVANRGQANQSTQLGATVDGISCDQLEHSTVHYHAHVSVYINGTAVQIPQYVGISTDASCFYWMHIHTSDGIIHIEAPTQQPYTLGNFFDIWSEQFSQLGYPLQLGASRGWTAYVNGQLYKGDFHAITLQSHTLVTLAYNSPNVKPDMVYNWGDLTK